MWLSLTPPKPVTLLQKRMTVSPTLCTTFRYQEKYTHVWDTMNWNMALVTSRNTRVGERTSDTTLTSRGFQGQTGHRQQQPAKGVTAADGRWDSLDSHMSFYTFVVIRFVNDYWTCIYTIPYLQYSLHDCVDIWSLYIILVAFEWTL